jgi:glycosyltransferase involved in cell wall biosynthesis
MATDHNRVIDVVEQLRIAVLIPCKNEENTIGTVIREMKNALPKATVYVYDNNSTDRTAEAAVSAGAVVGHESLDGKGHVVNRMFADIDADVYILIDGDDTYDTGSVAKLIETLVHGSNDMVSASRTLATRDAYPPGHQFGNVMITKIASAIFGAKMRDMLSGFRAFSKRFVKSFAGTPSGFELETELTFHALDMGMPIAEIDTPYRPRPQGSVSKLRTVADGLVILFTLVRLLEEEKPLTFFGIVSMLLGVAALFLTVPEAVRYLCGNFSPNFLKIFLASALIITSVITLVCGLILSTVTRGRKEMKRLKYISVPKLCPTLFDRGSRPAAH